jgi:hypothetical protein
MRFDQFDLNMLIMCRNIMFFMAEKGITIDMLDVYLKQKLKKNPPSIPDKTKNRVKTT